MSIDIQDYRPGPHALPPQDAFAQALDPSSSFLERLLVVEGGVGSGKSFTLSSAASSARASGHQVIELNGAGDDIVMASTSLSALLTLLPQTSRHSGRGGVRSDTDESRHVILVDDWHAFDKGTREQLHAGLSFLSRTTRTVSVIATNDRLLFPGWNALSLVALKPLTDREAEAVLTRNGIDLPPSRRRLLLRLAAGNPLILDLVGRAWSAASWEAKIYMFPDYPPCARLVAQAEERLAGVSRYTRNRLLVAAVAQVEFASDLPASGFRTLADTVGEALRAGVVTPTSGRVVFETPLIRAALLCAATERELAAARAEVAAMTASPDRLSLFVEASSADGLDDRLADRLGLGAYSLTQLGKPHEATAALLSASRLASSADARAEYLVQAADNAAYLGQFAPLQDCLDRAARTDGSVSPLVSAALAFRTIIHDGVDRRMKRDLLALLDATPDGDVADRILAVLQLACLVHGDATWWELATAAASGRTVEPVLRLVENCLATGAASEAEARRLVPLIEGGLAEAATWQQVSLHVAWMLLDPTDPRRAMIDQLFARGDGDDDLPGLLRLYRSGAASAQRGGWQHADSVLESARELAERIGASTITVLVDAVRLMLLSLRGEPEQARAAADSATRWALENGSPLIARVADHARSAIDLAAGNFEDAYARSAASPPMTGSRLRGGYGPIELLDAVEASARLRLPEHGRLLVETAGHALGEFGPPRLRMMLHACRAILDEGADGRTQFETALSSSSMMDAPFETARIRLAYGERLRRTMNPLEARAQFRIAAAAFESLGAPQWALRAKRELRAAGGISEVPREHTDNVLSEQERQVASLAARGLTNKQIAGQLYLSPRTVSGHLYRIFPKLGVTSRAGLRDALLGISGTDAELGKGA